MPDSSDISAIVLDVDGTLLDSQCHLSDANWSALQACARQGILLYAATARPQRLVFRPSEVTRDTAFLTQRGAFYNGAVALDKSLGYVKHWLLSADLVQDVTDYLMDVALPDLQIAIQSGDDYHSFWHSMDEPALTRWGFSREELLPFTEARRRDCSKICAFHEMRDLVDIYDGLFERYGRRLNVFLTDSGRWLQLMDGSVSKERAMLDLLALRGVPPERVVVFGDDAPDLGMFGTFGCSIAMANASTALKEAATYVTLSNDADGVAFALDELGIL